VKKGGEEAHPGIRGGCNDKSGEHRDKEEGATA